MVGHAPKGRPRRLEHLRQHARVARADQLQEDIVWRFVIGDSRKTTHLIEVGEE
jgi:hypothetical protein